MALIIVISVLCGIVAGLAIGRRFCKWHHKNDVTPLGAYPPGHPLGLSDDYCGPSLDTIGDEVEKCQPGDDCK